MQPIPNESINEERVCLTCGKSHEQLAREGVIPKHPFNDGSISTTTTFGRRLASGDRTPPGDQSVQVSEVRWPFDPVLRQALINKGVITPEDLTAAENQIRAVTDQFQSSGGVLS